jgi:F-type H+-transporting ATPase subunit delta
VTPGGPTASPTLQAAPSGVPARYAAALYELADEAHDLDSVVDQADALSRLIDESAPLRALLANPVLDIAETTKAIDAVLAAQGFGDLIRHFAGVIATNRRLAQLRAILSGFAALVAQRRGIVVADVSSAHPLTDLQRTQLLARLTEAGYGRVDIQERIDPSLLGGLVVRVGARLYDASLTSRLARLQYAMKGAA